MKLKDYQDKLNNLSLIPLSRFLTGENLIVLNDYIEELVGVSVEYTFSDDEYISYKYNPKKLALYLYQQPELYYILLLINNMSSINDFTQRRVRLISRTKLNDILSEIINAEKERLVNYN